MNALALGAFSAALGVVLGAFGAHSLHYLEPARLEIWKTASHYQFIASFGLMVAGLLDRGDLKLLAPSTAFVAGIFLFSGSLYALALGAPRWFGAITPLGGLSMIAGFVWLGILALRA
jgi:uncharacterized membrane protein YgdD (TMEM256/DUF423 family)